jgi:hypothetical protein
MNNVEAFGLERFESIGIHGLELDVGDIPLRS